MLLLPNGRELGEQRIERSEIIQWGEVSVGRLVGSEKQATLVSGTAQRAALAT